MGSGRTTTFPATATQLTPLSLTGKAKWRKPKLITAGQGSVARWERLPGLLRQLWEAAQVSEAAVGCVAFSRQK